MFQTHPSGSLQHQSFVRTSGFSGPGITLIRQQAVVSRCAIFRKTAGVQLIVQARATARHVEHQSRAQSHEARSGDHFGCRGQGHQGTVHLTSLSTCRSTLGPSMCLRFFLAQIAPCCTQHLWRLWSTTRSTRQVSHRHSPVRHSAKLWVSVKFQPFWFQRSRHVYQIVHEANSDLHTMMTMKMTWTLQVERACSVVQQISHCSSRVLLQMGCVTFAHARPSDTVTESNIGRRGLHNSRSTLL